MYDGGSQAAPPPYSPEFTNFAARVASRPDLGIENFGVRRGIERLVATPAAIVDARRSRRNAKK